MNYVLRRTDTGEYEAKEKAADPWTGNIRNAHRWTSERWCKDQQHSFRIKGIDTEVLDGYLLEAYEEVEAML